MTDYGYQVEVHKGYDEAVIRTRMALRAEGFSVLSEMHVGGLLGPDAGDERQYLIMGAWGPSIASRQLAPDISAGVHLPCNVVVQERGDSAIVAALDPGDVVDPGAEVAEQVTDQVRAALARVLNRVGAEDE